jgi:Sodium/hydrogen exchanger family
MAYLSPVSRLRIVVGQQCFIFDTSSIHLPPLPLLFSSRTRCHTGIGLSNTLGAFLAGLLLAETKYKYQIEADIAPFRGLLLGFFFITVGFNIDLGEWRGEARGGEELRGEARGGETPCNLVYSIASHYTAFFNRVFYHRECRRKCCCVRERSSS